MHLTNVKSNLSSKQVQVLGCLFQKIGVCVLVQVGKHLAICPFCEQPDAAIRGPGNDAHTAPFTAELHDVQNIKGCFVAQHAQRDALHVAADEFKTQLPATLYKGYLIWRGTLQNLMPAE